MRNIWTLFCGDLKRLTSNVVTVIIVLGLVFLPSLFSWYNLIACWNVFDNTGSRWPLPMPMRGIRAISCPLR